MTIGDRRDSFCGKMSACNNLWQYGIKYSLTNSTPWIRTPSLPCRPANFAATCRVVKGLRKTPASAPSGARPAAFNTVRYSEKLLEHAGITVETLDLSEVFGRIHRLADDEPRVKEKLANIGHTSTKTIPRGITSKDGQVRRGDGSMDAGQRAGRHRHPVLDRHARFFGVVPCTIMSMMCNNLIPSACETDIVGLIGMYALQFGSGQPPRIARLEQQLRRRSRQSGRLPLLQPAQSISSTTRRWITRKSSPAPSAKKTPTAPSWAT